MAIEEKSVSHRSSHASFCEVEHCYARNALAELGTSDMAQDRDSQVRERAHAIWLEEGMPEGQAEQHWNRAESEFADDEASATITPVSTDATPTEAPEATSGVSTSDNADQTPVAPDVEAITEPAAAPPASATKKQTRRKVKPVTPVR
jgi:hypothetical protein